MSYHSWTIDIYGVAMEDIDYTVNGVLALANMTEKTKNWFDEMLDGVNRENEIDLTAAVEQALDEYDCDSGLYGLGGLLMDVINNTEKYYFTVCEDYDGNQFVGYEPRYPWSLHEVEKNLSRENVEDIIHKYVEILTERKVVDNKCDYYSVENGG